MFKFFCSSLCHPAISWQHPQDCRLSLFSRSALSSSSFSHTIKDQLQKFSTFLYLNCNWFPIACFFQVAQPMGWPHDVRCFDGLLFGSLIFLVWRHFFCCTEGVPYHQYFLTHNLPSTELVFPRHACYTLSLVFHTMDTAFFCYLTRIEKPFYNGRGYPTLVTP